MKGKVFLKAFAVFLFAQSALFFSACNTGLGDAVDLKGPTVTIISPEARENVGEKFDIRGIVTDDFAVGTVTVELDGNTWRHKGSTWQYKAKDSNQFVADTESEWIQESKKSAEWTIKSATISGVGTFSIEVKALDEAGNSSAESSKSRDVIIDKSAPKITISSPPLAQYPSVFKNIEDYKDITKVTQFLTGDFSVSGKTAEENAIKYIEVLIKEDGAEEELFKKRIVQNEADKISDSDIVVDALRSWEIPVKLKECALYDLDEKQHILKIFTSTCDSAGNDSGLQLQGYACLWKEADKPWIDIILGDEKNPKNVYAGSSVLGNAYDDTAIKSVIVTIKNANGATIYEDFNEKEIYSASEDAEDENNVYFELPLPENSDTYNVEITATDKNGNKSDTKTGWIKIVDKLFPSVEASHTPGSQSETLFGDANGNFTFTIISKDETKVESLKMAYITNSTDIIEYSNSSSSKWNETTKITGDLKKGKVHEFALNDTGETITENGIKRKIYKNTLKINIFNDIGIDGKDKKLANQTFVFRVEDGDKNALTTTYTIQGDIEAPKIQFTKLEYYSYEGATSITREQEGGEMLPAFGEKTCVKVYGKIGDNSIDIWKDYKKYLALDLTANGHPITASVNADGTFEAEARNLTGASLVFEGNVTDWGGNSQKQKYSFLVDSQTPRVEYISALNKDGFYEAGETIQIFIRFNKKLEFSGNQEITLNNGVKVPRAASQTGIGANDILFEYKIGKNGESVDSLNVTAVSLGTVKNDTADVTAEINKSIQEIIKNASLGKNLAKMKSIGIITSAPQVKDIKFDDSTSILTITYDKAIAKGNGVVTITQQKGASDGVDKVPAVLTEAEGRVLFGKNDKLQDYYELTTNGADSNFKADLTSKYVLKYEYDSNDSKVVAAYEATGAHILSQDVRSQNVSVEDKTVTVTFNSPIPCKGATYKIEVPEGFMQDAKGGSKFKASGKIEPHSTSGVEKPVIRIKKGTTTVNNYAAIQPLTAEFKVDCETPGATVQYQYKEYKRDSFTVIGRGSNTPPDVLPANRNKETKTLSNKVDLQNYLTPVTIGSKDNRHGLEYNIVAEATKGDFPEKANGVAYRTTIEITGVPLPNQDDSRWNKKDGNTTIENNTQNSKGCGLFIRGGDTPTGANSTQGLPTDWDITHNTKTCLLTRNDNTNRNDNTYDYYFVTWAIATDYYFMFLAGLMDEKTISDKDGISQGPYCGIFGQNSWVSFYKNYPVPPGGYAKIDNANHSHDGDQQFKFELETVGKVQKYR